MSLKVRKDGNRVYIESPLEPGLYVLTEDVENPNPDRRVKYDWRCRPTIPKGVVFELSITRTSGDIVMELPELAPHKRLGKRIVGGQRIVISTQQELFEAIVASLERRPESKPRETVKGVKERAKALATYLEAEGDTEAARLLREVVIGGAAVPTR
jgi:hypothetical protein